MFYGMRVEPGATVEATDRQFGTVDEVMLQPESGELAYLTVRHAGDLVRIPAGMIDEVADPREVRLGLTYDEAHERIAGRVAGGGHGVGQDGPEGRIGDAPRVRIPIHEERLGAVVQPVSLGEVRVHKHVEHAEETVEQPIVRDDLDIERVPMHEQLDAPVGPRQEDGWFVMPIMEEVLVVQKRLMLVEEVRIRRRQVTEIARVRETVRRERVTLEDATVHGVDGTDVDQRGRRRRPTVTDGGGDAAGERPSGRPVDAARID